MAENWRIKNRRLVLLPREDSCFHLCNSNRLRLRLDAQPRWIAERRVTELIMNSHRASVTKKFLKKKMEDWWAAPRPRTITTAGCTYLKERARRVLANAIQYTQRLQCAGLTVKRNARVRKAVLHLAASVLQLANQRHSRSLRLLNHHKIYSRTRTFYPLSSQNLSHKLSRKW